MHECFCKLISSIRALNPLPNPSPEGGGVYLNHYPPPPGEGRERVTEAMSAEKKS